MPSPFNTHSQSDDSIHQMNVGPGFQLHDDLPIDQQVSSEAALQLHFVIDQRHWLLFLDLEPSFAKFIGETNPVRGFQQAGTRAFVDFDGGTDDGLREFVGFHVGSLFGRKQVGNTEAQSSRRKRRTQISVPSVPLCFGLLASLLPPPLLRHVEQHSILLVFDKGLIVEHVFIHPAVEAGAGPAARRINRTKVETARRFVPG